MLIFLQNLLLSYYLQCCISFLDTPSQRVQFILGTEDDEDHVPHELFTELDEICQRGGEDAEWKETARCVNCLQCLCSEKMLQMENVSCGLFSSRND